MGCKSFSALQENECPCLQVSPTRYGGSMDARNPTPLSVVRVTKLEWNRDYSPLSFFKAREVFVFLEVTICSTA